MSKRLSREDKKEIILKFLQEKKEPFQLPELEKSASKLGVVLQTVKEIVVELCSEYLVENDKIGVSQFYWSFPSAATNRLKVTKAGLEASIADSKKSVALLKDEHTLLELNRQPTEARIQQLAELAEEKKRVDRLNEELQVYAENDPMVLEALESDVQVGFEAANRWTENILQMRKWAMEKFNLEKKEFNLNFGLPDDFDDIEI